MKEVFPLKGRVKSYSQNTFWLNGIKGNTVVGKLRKSSYHYPHGVVAYDLEGNVLFEDYKNFDGQNIRREYTYNSRGKITKLTSSGKTLRVYNYQKDGL